MHTPTEEFTNSLTLSSIEAYKSYGVTPNNLRFIVQNLFYFPEQYSDALWKYYLQEIETHEFLAHMKDGMYDAQGRSYQVIYNRTDPTKLLRRQDHTTVKLSFRVVQDEFNIIPTVLVREVMDTREVTK